MERSKYILGLIAFVVGTGSAFCSIQTPDEVFVKGQYGDTESDVECINTHRECSPSNSRICVVIVPLKGGVTQIALTNGIYKTYRVGCIWELGSPTLVVQIARIDALDGFPTRLISDL